jgi:hypothetical protein
LLPALKSELSNDARIDMTILPIFWASTVEMAYMVVKKANRRVMKSA